MDTLASLCKVGYSLFHHPRINGPISDRDIKHSYSPLPVILTWILIYMIYLAMVGLAMIYLAMVGLILFLAVFYGTMILLTMQTLLYNQV